MSDDTDTSTLILIRHGLSAWNSENRFTGWVDTPLSEAGIEEAKKAAMRLTDVGIQVDQAFTSSLQRAIDTGRIVLDGLGQPDLEQVQAWQLNERFYGALTGRNKEQTAQEFGAEQVHVWRRSYDIPPPGGESLKDTAARVLPYFDEVVRPAAVDGRVVLVSAHGNSLRAIVKELDQISDDEITALEIGTGVPLVYGLRDGRIVSKEILNQPEP